MFPGCILNRMFRFRWAGQVQRAGMNRPQTMTRIVVAALAVSTTLGVSPARADPQSRYAGHPTAVLNCSSDSYQKVRCGLQGGGDILDASVVRRMSNAGCNRRDDWDVESGALWVRNGCRADFEVVLAADAYAPDDDLAGGPGSYGHPREADSHDYEYRDDDRRDGEHGDRDAHPLSGRLSQSIAACAREANEIAWEQGAWSAQYTERPRLVETRSSFELRGRLRIHDERGFHTEESRCEVRRGEVIDFELR